MREYFKPKNNLFNETELQQNFIDTKEKITRNQSYCDAWYQQKAARITGLIIHQVYLTSVKKQVGHYGKGFVKSILLS